MRTELPEKWYIKCTKENHEILNSWRLSIATTYLGQDCFNPGHYLVSKHHSDDGSYYYSGSLLEDDPDYEDYIKLTLKEFKILVLNQPKPDPIYEIY